MATILVVDPNEAFATMLKDMLETEGGHQVKVAHRGSDVLTLLEQSAFDLTIVDMDLDPADMGCRDLIVSIRQAQPTMRVVLIPLMGEDLPPEVHRLDIQGALSKPFFADDLLPGIQEALSREVRVGLPPAQQIDEQRPAVGAHRADEVQPVLAELIHETQADAAWLLSGGAGAEQVVTYVSTMDEEHALTLAELSAAVVRAAQAIAHFLGQPDEPFEHNMFENDVSRLYIMTLPGDLSLVVVGPVHTPLGTIRHNLRRAWRQLDRLALT
jgi:CheY-like chemotaxis protein